MTDATIAIITYMRPMWLQRLLYALSRQEINSDVSVCILVVDNACDSETKRIVELVGEKTNIDIFYAIEETRGIVAARNKCVDIFLKSDSKNLVFIDDDEWPKHSNWLQTLLDKKDSYAADVVTSHVLSVGESGAPDWAINLIYGKNKNKEGDFVNIFYTNNLLLTRHVLESVRPAFDSRFAMTGASDYHFSLKCFHRGFKAIYVDAPVEEEFPASRATIKWFLRRGFRSGIGYTRSHLFEEDLFKAIFRICIMSVVRFLRGIVNLLYGCLTFSKVKTVSGLFRISSGVGTLAGFFGIKYNEYNRIHGK